jgi:hypothetical protein
MANFAAAARAHDEAQGVSVIDAPQIGPCPVSVPKKTETTASTNPVLIAFLIALGVFPFVVWFLPQGVVQHLDVLFH